nr:protein disabled isoform X2 [Onthophagus taurus]
MSASKDNVRSTGKGLGKMQTLRKKSSPLKYKNETTRFLGEGVSFKAKLIGILEVSEARGDRMCQEALSDLKTAIRAAGEHKQRITINIAIDGLRLRDEKTGDSLYHHPVHKISFIAQDMTDSRAFGYIFGSPETGLRFFGIKTDKAASQVVIAMRDLFQVVFALKKKEIELAKQHLDKNRLGSSSLFSESPISSKTTTSDTTIKTTTSDTKSTTNTERTTPAVADLVDLELELNSLQQGLHQMERITPSDPFGSKDDPFGDSFTPFPPMLPPPPSSGKDRANRSSDSSSLFSPKTPHTAGSLDTLAESSVKEPNLSHDFSLNDEPSSGDWFTPPAGNSLFEEPPLAPEPAKSANQDQHEKKKQDILSQFDVFTDLDPLGTGKLRPYVDKKHFFQELKNPPKKVLKDLVQEGQTKDASIVFPANFDHVASNDSNSSNLFTADPFGDDPFVKSDPFAEADFAKQDPFDTELFKETPEQFKFQKTKSVNFKSKQNTFDVNFDKLTHLHENPSLDLSSESECAPEPPPRPVANLTQIKPPPLPPKKAPEFCVKPPPRPPYNEDSHYDYMENFETAPNSLSNSIDYSKDKSPPLPVPQRKSKFESDFTNPPDRPLKKGFVSSDDNDDYLTPISLPQVLLPPPQKAKKQNLTQVTVSSYLESKPNLTTTLSGEKNVLLGVDITLNQLTSCGLNELAKQLELPATQLSNMTLAQYTSYLQEFLKKKSNVEPESKQEATNFQADFANFNDFNVKTSETYDRYAVFRELLQEEIKQTKIDTEPEEIAEKLSIEVTTPTEQTTQIKEINEITPTEEIKITNTTVPSKQTEAVVDRYAALREIVDIEIKNTSIEENEEDENKDKIDELNGVNRVMEENDLNEQNSKNLVDTENEVNIMNTEKFEEKEKSKVIEYPSPIESKIVVTTPVKSPEKLPKSPLPEVVEEVIKNDARITSGSLSDVVSGSSPEIDNTGSNSEVKKSADATDPSKQHIQSEEGVSPWSSDSKEFGNGSPPDWRPRVDSESGGEHWHRRRPPRGAQDGWWDTSAEPEAQYYPSNRRSTDSYEDECYECYDRPRRRRQQPNWGAPPHTMQGTGGHSSSSRDVSPWEEEPSRRRQDLREYREPRQVWSSKHGRQHSFDRHRDKRHNDSWDEEDDYEYEEEHRFHWQERHSASRDADRHPREETIHGWCPEDWPEDRKHRRRRETERGGGDRWCCPDWEQSEEKSRYGPRWEGPTSSQKWRDRKHDDRYYSRDSQESPWEDEYSNEPEEPAHPTSHYLAPSRKTTWKRPSSASEMDRKGGEFKGRSQGGGYHLNTGGSDGERDRRYKPSRRSKSRESPFSDISHNRHKGDSGPPLRSRAKHHHEKPHFERDFPQELKKQSEIPNLSNKKTSTLGRKKKDTSPKTEEVNTFPRKSTQRCQSLFENDFVPTETDSPESVGLSKRFTFENDFETSEADSPIIKSTRHEVEKEKNVKLCFQKPGYQRNKQRSLFEDDFSPTERVESVNESSGISSIKEEGVQDEQGVSTFSVSNVKGNGIRKKILSKGRLSSNSHDGLKKSESVNIFARENDPFDDEFFSGGNSVNSEKISPRTTELKWTQQFDDFKRK